MNIQPDTLHFYTIYKDPLDYNEKGYVVRVYKITPEGIVPGWATRPFETLELARRFIPLGLFNVGRQLTDESHIIESWI